MKTNKIDMKRKWILMQIKIKRRKKDKQKRKKLKMQKTQGEKKDNKSAMK